MVLQSDSENPVLEHLEEQLRQAQKMETVALLAGGIAHDFNNLLTVINGYTDLLLVSPGLPEEARKCIAISQRVGRRAARLVRGLLSFSRRMPLEPTLMEINPMVTELATLVSSFLPPNIEFSVDLEPLTERIFADPGSLQQVLLNLVINSRDAMLEGGKLAIATSSLEAGDAIDPHLPPGNYVLLTVSDTGAGMDEETKRCLFEAYYTTKPAGSGTGLGLHMVHQIVKQSGGVLRVDSSLGSGSTVRIYLPSAGGEAMPDNRPSKGQPRGGSETILLVEDNADLRRLLCSVLESSGYAVLEAESAGEASQLFNGLGGAIDLLVADVTLADSSGVELARDLQASRQGLPVLHISGYLEDDDGEGRNASGAEFLSKPFTMDAFGERVRRMLDKRRRRRVLFVDDDPEVVIFASRILRDAGFEVLVGGNGNVALSTAQTEPLDLLITDLVMPEREGLETIMRLRKSHPALPVIAISGAFGGHFLKGAATLGASAVLAKPFSAGELLEAVRAAMEIA